MINPYIGDILRYARGPEHKFFDNIFEETPAPTPTAPTDIDNLLRQISAPQPTPQENAGSDGRMSARDAQGVSPDSPPGIGLNAESNSFRDFVMSMTGLTPAGMAMNFVSIPAQGAVNEMRGVGDKPVARGGLGALFDSIFGDNSSYTAGKQAQEAYGDPNSLTPADRPDSAAGDGDTDNSSRGFSDSVGGMGWEHEGGFIGSEHRPTGKTYGGKPEVILKALMGEYMMDPDTVMRLGEGSAQRGAHRMNALRHALKKRSTMEEILEIID